MALNRQSSATSPALDQFQSTPRRQRSEPFLKWAGGKQRLLSVFDPFLPEDFEDYYEPFLGGGAVFFYLNHIGRIKKALLSDLNNELMNVWRLIRDDVERVIAQLSEYEYDKDLYYTTREMDPEKMTPIARAARTMYLNRTCFNGLYRVNSKGEFNVPFGRYKNPLICNSDNLRRVHQVLQNVELQAWGFENVLESAGPGDFIYFDPPYVPVTRTSSFTAYTALPFNEAHQGRLREVFTMLDRRGCQVMLSNSDTPLVRELYKGYDIREIQAPRAINRNGLRRGNVTELVVRNYR
jgi:DNA adenine methylase